MTMRSCKRLWPEDQIPEGSFRVAAASAKCGGLGAGAANAVGCESSIIGRSPISGYDDLVTEWRANGNTIRAEYERAFQQAKS